MWVEKILDPDERLRDWPVSGTVGYEFLNDVCALFVDPAGEAALTALWQRDLRRSRGVRRGRARGQARAGSTGRSRPRSSGWRASCGAQTPPAELETLGPALASLPVYRTYVDPSDRTRRLSEDRLAIDAATMAPAIARMLLLERPAPAAFVTRFQQTTPAIMAKGVEDTAFYRYGRLLALNDVGGDPGRFGIAVERFHAGEPRARASGSRVGC